MEVPSIQEVEWSCTTTAQLELRLVSQLEENVCRLRDEEKMAGNRSGMERRAL